MNYTENLEVLVKKAIPGHRVPKAIQEIQVHKARKVIPAKPVRRVQKEIQVRRVPKVTRVIPGIKEALTFLLGANRLLLRQQG